MRYYLALSLIPLIFSATSLADEIELECSPYDKITLNTESDDEQKHYAVFDPQDGSPRTTYKLSENRDFYVLQRIATTKADGEKEPAELRVIHKTILNGERATLYMQQLILVDTVFYPMRPKRCVLKNGYIEPITRF